VWPRGVDGFPIHLGKRRTCGEPLDEVGICDVRAAKRNQVSQPFCDKPIPALAMHIHVGDQGPLIDRAEMPEHAIVGQLFQGSAGKVSCVSHEQEARKVVCVQLPDGILGNRQGLIVGCERAPPCIGLILTASGFPRFLRIRLCGG